MFFLYSYYLECPVDDCTWVLTASSLNTSRLFEIRKFCDKHTYNFRNMIYSKRQATTEVVGAMIMDKYTDAKRIYTPRDISTDIKKTHGVSLTYMQAWRAKEQATKLLRGDSVESYTNMPRYIYIFCENLSRVSH